MSYDPTTDFLGLLRLTGTAVRSERTPGLDWLVAALNRMGLFALVVGQAAPTSSQTTTVWFQPSLPAWSAEGQTWLWDAVAGAYAAATPALWVAFLAAINSGYLFQSCPDPVNVIAAGTTLAAVQRVNPVTTNLQLPVLGAQFQKAVDLTIVDFSTGLVAHTLALSTPDGSTIMANPGGGWAVLSNPDNRGTITLSASPDLNAWIIK